jgi:mRNA interferase HigB
MFKVVFPIVSINGLYPYIKLSQNGIDKHPNMGYIKVMRIIDRKMLESFYQTYPDSEKPLLVWYKLMKQNTYSNLVELKQVIPSVDQVGRATVFNIKGNDYRLIAAIHYNTKIVYTLEVMTHEEYDKETWKKRHDVFS